MKTQSPTNKQLARELSTLAKFLQLQGRPVIAREILEVRKRLLLTPEFQRQRKPS